MRISRWPLRRIPAVLAAFALTTSALPQPGVHARAQTPATATTSIATSPAQTSNGLVPGQPTAQSHVTAAKIASLPVPFPPGLIQGIDAKAESPAILAHLSEVVRYFRMSFSSVQKIGEPSDILYAQQMQSEAVQMGQLAFKAARGQAAFLARVPSSTSAEASDTAAESSKVNERLRAISTKINDLETQSTAIDQQLGTAKRAQRGSLEDQKGDVEGQLKLYNAILSALQKIVISSKGEPAGLQGDIDRLQHSAPELVDAKYKPVASTIESIGPIRDAGVTSQATMLFQLMSSQSAINERIQELQTLHTQAEALREPLAKVLIGTLAKAQTIEQDTGSSASDLASKAKQYDDLTSAFNTLSDIAIPISQEVLVLEQAQSTLVSWRSSVAAEQKSILQALLLRIAGIAVMLGFILGIGALWRQAATRYVQDVRRRRQILLIRRLVIGFLSGIVLIMGFVTQFNSLATFAGFITAGIAVGLQTILLSVAAYFFIVGRYGIRVGDRITVAGVTGEVVEVGLVRFYMLELTGSGTEYHSTGRVAVFANSVLFQTGTPLYKQLPGTGYAWHEIAFKIKPTLDYRPTLNVLRGIVDSVYATYKTEIEKQHRGVEVWMDTAIEAPRVETRLQLTDGMQYVVLYPILIDKAAATDEAIVQQVTSVLAKDQAISDTIDGTPTVRAVVKS